MRYVLCLVLIICTLASAKPRIAIVIDDLGRSTEDCQFFAALPVSLNCAVIPGMPYARACADIISQHQQTLLIHFPWENLGRNPAQHYPIRLTSTMTTEDMKVMFTRAFQSVPGAQGINNHMGSVLSKNPQAMHKVMTIMAQLPQKKFFLDSHTSPQTKAYAYALADGLPAALNNFFLDGFQSDLYIERQFGLAVQYAEKHGSAIAICHGNRQVTRHVFEKCISLYNTRVAFVSLTELVKTRTKE